MNYNGEGLAQLILGPRPSIEDKIALAILGERGDLRPREALTFRELRRRVARLQRGLARLGLRPGDRVVLLAPMSVDFFALSLALLASGQVLVFLDGRLDPWRVLRVLRAARPQGIVSIRGLLRLWPLLPPLWRARRVVADSEVRGLAGTPLRALLGGASGAGDSAADGDGGALEPSVLRLPPDSSALLSFTSGTTGRPKGADRTHGILLAQHLALKGHAPERGGEVDMPCFPAVVLHNLACGISSVLPPIDLRRPGAADPGRVLQAVRRFGVTSLSGAPAYMGRLCDEVLRGGAVAPPLQRLFVGGAPVSRGLARRLLSAFPGAAAEAVYGSTEAEPMSSVPLQELAESSGDGYLVGRPAPVAELALVDLPQTPPPLPAAGLAPFQVPEGHSGEVLVRGPHVNQRYVGDEEAARRLKVPAPDGGLWHRTGDLARRDGQGRLWLTGRLPDRVRRGGRWLLPYVVEAALAEEVPAAQGALIAHDGAPEGELVLRCGREDEEGALAAARDLLRRLGLADLPLRRVSALPMDARHNSKIDRPRLREQLARTRTGRVTP